MHFQENTLISPSSPSGFDPSGPQPSGLSYGLPPARGLYDPTYEQDSCGIGFVADVQGRRTHRTVERAIEAVCCLTHRGAVAADAKTGDGAGILTQIPHRLLRAGLGKGQGQLPRRDEGLAGGGAVLPPNGAH